MKPLFEISDPIELLALWRLVAEAKFQADPEDTDLWGSPYVHALAQKIADAMLNSYRDAGQEEAIARHTKWVESLPNNVVLPVVKAQLKRDATRSNWPSCYEGKFDYVKRCIAPFRADEEFIHRLIVEAES